VAISLLVGLMFLALAVLVGLVIAWKLLRREFGDEGIRQDRAAHRREQRVEQRRGRDTRHGA
jgi:hypothetical protein